MEPAEEHSGDRWIRIEQQIATPLDQEQRQRLRDRLAQSDRLWTPETIAAIPDGTEPGFVFHPLARAGGTPPEGGHHG
jgi:ABC-type branched-subunit amino acid transport system substrate-binding protein